MVRKFKSARVYLIELVFPFLLQCILRWRKSLNGNGNCVAEIYCRKDFNHDRVSLSKDSINLQLHNEQGQEKLIEGNLLLY